MIGLLVLFPAQAAALLGFGTSSSETMQRTSRVDDSGISTAIRRPAQPTIAVTPAVRPTPALARPNDPTQEELSDEARARLTALEEAIQRLADRPAGATGPTADEIQALLDRQSAVLREEADARENLLRAQLDALQAGAYVDDGTVEAERLRLEAEERARLRERAERRREEHEAELARRTAEREAELVERRLSDANVFDESEYGATSGAADEAGVRELSEDELFRRDAGNATVKTVRARTLRDPSSTVVQGTVIPAVVETAIDTQLPGTLRAQVTRPVWSFDGSRVVMPAGTRRVRRSTTSGQSVRGHCQTRLWPAHDDTYGSGSPVCGRGRFTASRSEIPSSVVASELDVLPFEAGRRRAAVRSATSWPRVRAFQ